MPAGFHVASAWVDIHAESAGLKNEIKRAIEGAVAGDNGKVKLNVDAGTLRARVQSAIKSATTGAEGKVKLDLDAGALRGKVESAVKAAAAGARGEIKLDLDAGSLRAKIQAATKAAGARVDIGVDLKDGEFKSKLASMVAIGNAAKINVKMDVDTGAFSGKVQAAIQAAGANNIDIGIDVKDLAATEAKIAALVAKHRTIKIDADIDFSAAHVAALKGMRVKINTDIDAGELQGKIRAAVAAGGAATKIRIGTDIDYVGKFAAFRAAVAAIHPTIHVNVDVDRNRWQQWLSEISQGANNAGNSVGNMGRMMTNASSVFTSGGGLMLAAIAVLGPAIMVIVADVALLAAALAAIALPIGIIALGTMLQTTKAELKAFMTDLQGVSKAVSQAFGPAMTAGMSQIKSSIAQLGPALNAMFANAGQLVQPMIQSFQNLASGAIPGITAALNNMKSAMPGIQAGFSAMGQGVGSFFQQLTQNGAAIGTLWQTIGNGIKTVMTSLGSMMSGLASNPAVVQMLAQSFQLLGQSVQLVGQSIQAFAPVMNTAMSALSSGMTAVGPAIDNLGRLSSAFSTLTSGGGPINAFKQLFGGGDDPAKKMAESMKEAAAAAATLQNGPLGQIGKSSAEGATAVRQQAQAFEELAKAAAKLDGNFGAGTGILAQNLAAIGKTAQDASNSVLKLGQNAQSALGGQIGLAQAIADGKAKTSEFAGALTMTNGQLNLTSQKSRDAASALNNIAQAGTQAATSFMNQGNWSAAGQAIDQARQSIVALGQSFGLSLPQAQQLANTLLTFPDKEVQFKLNVAQAKAGLTDVQNAFKQLSSGEHKVVVNAMTAPAQAALEALGFKIKDLGNGKVEVQANTEAAKASLDGLQTVLDALASGQHEVSIKADQIPAVSAALTALGATVTSLPNGDIKITAKDGATTIVHGVKAAMDAVPATKQVAITANGVGPGIDQVNQFVAGISKIPGSKQVTITANGVGPGIDQVNQFVAGISKIPASKNTTANLNGNAAAKAKETATALDDIPANKETQANMTGDAATKAAEVELKINGLPASKTVIVMVNISGTEQIDKLTALNAVNNKAIAVSVSITGTEQIDKLTALNAVNNKNIQVTVNISGADQIAKLTALNAVNNKNISVTVSIQGNLDKMAELQQINTINNKNISVQVNIGGNLDKLAELKQLNSINAKNISVNVSISGADQISKLKELNNIQSKSITVTVNANAGPIQQIKTALAGINNKTVTVNVSANAGPVNTLKSAIAGIANKSVTVTATAPTGAVNTLKSTIASVQGKTVTVTANVNGLGAVQSLIAAIAAVQSKTVTVTVNTVKTGSAAGGGYMHADNLPGFATGGRSVKGGGNVNGIGSGTSDSILARLSNGEFVVRASMVKKYGTEFLTAINHGALGPMLSNMSRRVPGFSSGGEVSLGNVQPGDRGDEVLLLQKALKEIFPDFDYSSGPGVFGPRTKATYSKFQKSMGYSGSGANGSPGMASLVALANRTGEFSIRTSQNVIDYVIKWGDTLTSIARKFGTSVDELVKLNHISNPDRIGAGDHLKIPVHGGTPKTIPAVLPGTKPGDWNYLAPPKFSKLTIRKDSEGKDDPAIDTLKEKTGVNTFAANHYFGNLTGTGPTIANAIKDATDPKSLADALDSLRTDVIHGLTDTSGRNSLLEYIAQGGKIELGYQKMLADNTKSLEEAKKSQDELTTSYKSLIQSVSDTVHQFATLVKTGKAGASTETMLRQLTLDAGKSQQFSQGISSLKGRGLNGTTLAQIAASGPVDGNRTMQSLLQATPEQLAQINALQTQIDAAGLSAGTAAADAMYKAGMDASKGLVDGLTAQKTAIEDAMKMIAMAMQTAIKQALGIKSPSTVFHGFGVNTIRGYINGALAEGKDVPAIIQSICDQMGLDNKGRTGNWTAPAVDAAAGTSATGTAPGSGNLTVHGGIHVRIDGSNIDFKNPEECRKVAKDLGQYIVEEIRDINRKRS